MQKLCDKKKLLQKFSIVVFFVGFVIKSNYFNKRHRDTHRVLKK